VKTKQEWLGKAPGESLEAIGSILGAHWSAAKSQQSLLFARGSGGSWLGRKAWRTQLTTLRAAANSSDTRPDPHPC
jgi:hypothetical protein